MADNFVCNILKMLIFCFSNHSFLQKWLFFSLLQAPLSPSHHQGLSQLFLFPLPTGEKPNPTHLLLAWQRGTAGTCVSVGRQGWPSSGHAMLRCWVHGEGSSRLSKGFRKNMCVAGSTSTSQHTMICRVFCCVPG